MSYESEYLDALGRIDEENKGLEGLGYFLDTVKVWHEYLGQECSAGMSGGACPQVVILGNGIPEQLVYACGAVPIRLLGGSHASCAWSDDYVPRDSDPQSRSILGYALRLGMRTDIDPLFVVPMESDNMRKAASVLMSEGKKVLPIDIPPVISTLVQQRGWEESLVALMEAVCHHMGTRVTASSIRGADALVARAREALIDFERTCAQCSGVLTGEAMLLVIGSYQQTFDQERWTACLRSLIDEMHALPRPMGRFDGDGPRVLVVGSAIVCPQYKVASLIQDAGLVLASAVDATSTTRYASLETGMVRGGIRALVRAIAARHYAFDASGAHVENQALERYVAYQLSAMGADGVVFHVLKGQIEHDFALTRLDPFFERMGVPVFRLETDYQYQDVEQLRIRLEAFAEMLHQRTYAESHARVRLHCA